jgi:hypothetical protein
MPPAERRKHVRLESLNLVSYACLDENEMTIKQGMARTLNITEAGILLEIEDSVDPPQAFLLTLGLQEHLLTLKGGIVHSHKDPYGRTLFGIKFQGVDEDSLQTLRTFVAEFKNNPT